MFHTTYHVSAKKKCRETFYFSFLINNSVVLVGNVNKFTGKNVYQNDLVFKKKMSFGRLAVSFILKLKKCLTGVPSLSVITC